MKIKKKIRNNITIIATLLSFAIIGFLSFILFLSFVWDDEGNTYEKDCLIAAEILKPLIEALEDFNRDNKKYPESLEVLVPIYINKIPKMPSPFYSFPGNNGVQYEVLNSPDTQPYELKIERGGGMASDITLYYFSIPDLEKYRPESSVFLWKNYRNKTVITNNWVYCY